MYMQIKYAGSFFSFKVDEGNKEAIEELLQGVFPGIVTFKTPNGTTVSLNFSENIPFFFEISDTPRNDWPI